MRAARKLQAFREHLDKPITVNTNNHSLRGTRSPEENYLLQASLGNKPFKFSFHLQGRAFDINVDGLTVEEIADAAIWFGWTGVIKYPTFVHIDLRDERPYYKT